MATITDCASSLARACITLAVLVVAFCAHRAHHASLMQLGVFSNSSGNLSSGVVTETVTRDFAEVFAERARAGDLEAGEDCQADDECEDGICRVRCCYGAYFTQECSLLGGWCDADGICQVKMFAEVAQKRAADVLARLTAQQEAAEAERARAWAQMDAEANARIAARAEAAAERKAAADARAAANPKLAAEREKVSPRALVTSLKLSGPPASLSCVAWVCQRH